HTNNGNNRLLAGKNGGVRRWPAVTGDEPEHLVEVEQGGVSRCKVTRDEHKRVIGVRHARRSHTGELCDDPLRDVVEVGSPLPQVAAHRGELVAEVGERLEYGALGRGSAGEALVDDFGEHRVL